MSRRCLLGLLTVLAVLAAGCDEGNDVVEPVVIDVPREEAPSRTVGFDTTTFNVGVILDLTGPAADRSRQLLAGVEAYWSTVNAAGGVDGRFPVQLLVRDSEGSVAAAVGAFRDLEPDIAMLALVGGTSEIDAIRELAHAEDLLIVPATRQSSWGLAPSLLPFGASYAVESLAAITWMSRDDTTAVPLCVIRDASKVSEDLTVGVALAHPRLDLVDEPIVISTPDPTGAPGAIDQIGEVGCERLYLAAEAPVTGALLDELAARELDVEVAIGSDVSLPLAPATSAWAVGRVVQVADVPSWGDDGAGAAALRNSVATFLPDAAPNPWIRSGFASQYLVDVLLTTTTRNGSVTRADLGDFATDLAPIDTGGLVGTPDRSAGAAGFVRTVTVHEFDSVGVDPLGLRPVDRSYVPETIDAINLLFPA